MSTWDNLYHIDPLVITNPNHSKVAGGWDTARRKGAGKVWAALGVHIVGHHQERGNGAL